MTTTSLTLALLEAFIPRWRPHRRGPVRTLAHGGAAANWQVPLERRQLRRFERGGVQSLRCVSGTLWITFDGDLADHVLQAGETIEAEGRGAVIAYALEAAVLRVQGAIDRGGSPNGDRRAGA